DGLSDQRCSGTPRARSLLGPIDIKEARMKRTAISNVVLGCGLATLLAAFGCGGDHNATNGTAAGNGTGQPAAAGADRTGTPGAATGTAATTGSAADENNARTPVTLTG